MLARLISINARLAPACSTLRIGWRPKMPIETYIASAVALVFFGTFLAAMAWVVWYTRGVTPRW